MCETSKYDSSKRTCRKYNDRENIKNFTEGNAELSEEIENFFEEQITQYLGNIDG